MIRITPNSNDGFALIRVIPNDFASGYTTGGSNANTASFPSSEIFVLWLYYKFNNPFVAAFIFFVKKNGGRGKVGKF